jgi:hypothetical protein
MTFTDSLGHIWTVYPVPRRGLVVLEISRPTLTTDAVYAACPVGEVELLIEALRAAVKEGGGQ